MFTRVCFRNMVLSYNYFFVGYDVKASRQADDVISGSDFTSIDGEYARLATDIVGLCMLYVS